MSEPIVIHDPKKYLAESFLRASAVIQQHYLLGAITRKWNASRIGKPTGEKTIERWLSPGPKTKNPRFETWVVGLASQFS
jgi:hypothetical protein